MPIGLHELTQLLFYGIDGVIMCNFDVKFDVFLALLARNCGVFLEYILYSPDFRLK